MSYSAVNDLAKAMKALDGKKSCGRVFLCGRLWFVFVLLAGLTFSGALVVVAPALCLAVSGFPSGIIR